MRHMSSGLVVFVFSPSVVRRFAFLLDMHDIIILCWDAKILYGRVACACPE